MKKLTKYLLPLCLFVLSGALAYILSTINESKLKDWIYVVSCLTNISLATYIAILVCVFYGKLN